MIADFAPGSDKIELDNAVFSGLGGTGILGSDAFHVGTAAADAQDRIVYNDATGALLYDEDGTGGAAAIHFATVGTGLSLASTDFVIV